MPWCPKCKLEYREGVTVCTDCGSELVNDLSMSVDKTAEEIVRLQSKEKAEQFINYLEYSNIHETSYFFDEVDTSYVIEVEKKDSKEAKKLLQAFLTAELEEEQAEPDPEETTTFDTPDVVADQDVLDTITCKAKENVKKKKKSGVYVKKEDQYNDVRSSGFTFLIVGIIGILFMLLNYFGVLKLYNEPFQMVVGSAIFVALLIIGLVSLKHSKQIKQEIAAETSTTKEILDWLDKTISKEQLQAICDSNEQEEINYFKKIEYIKINLIKHLGDDINDSYIDYVIDEFYNSKFEQ